MNYVEKKPLAITVFSGIAVLAIIMIVKHTVGFPAGFVPFIIVPLFLAGFVFYFLYLSAYSKETSDETIWDFGFSGAAKRIPWFYSGAYKRNILALNVYLWIVLAFLSPYLILLL